MRIVKETNQPGVRVVRETKTPGVRIVGETTASSPVEEPEDIAAVSPAEEEPAVDLAASEIEVEDLTEEVMPEDTVEAQLSTKEALDQAMAWTVEGLRHYQSGSVEAAHKSLTDAHFRFLEADLPEPLVARGLNLFQADLPPDLQLYDPEAIRLHLDRTDRPGAIELAERALVEAGVRRLLWQLGDPPAGERYLEDLIAETHRTIQYFQGRKRQFFETTYRRKHKYWPTIRSIFAEKELPPELGYMAFVESAFQPQAKSVAAAVGIWQFIEETGHTYGLQSPADFHDPEKSTRAAAAYLFVLSNQFGSRLLAVAAYNCGEGRITKCLRKIDAPGKRSFWGIRACLPDETKEYVPRVLAAAVIGSAPKLFGFDLPHEEEMLTLHDVVIVPDVTSLVRLSELAGTDLASLRRDNSELAGRTSTPGRNYPLYVPKGRGALVIAGLAVEERKPSIAPITPIEMAPLGQPLIHQELPTP